MNIIEVQVLSVASIKLCQQSKNALRGFLNYDELLTFKKLNAVVQTLKKLCNLCFNIKCFFINVGCLNVHISFICLLNNGVEDLGEILDSPLCLLLKDVFKDLESILY